ncbi:hypothetical protein AB9F29_00125 [Falsihalocynthiibacter sp. S25ZX9]|uniref:hypothetical protein n=1 Tax=Falsihalocynthiibacter sp. S25ZX9 TaxID=3240870 RepID=UPI0035105CF1
MMIYCESHERSGSMGVSLQFTKMKDEKSFQDLGAAFEKVGLSGGKSSLVLAGKFDFLAACNGHTDTTVDILRDKFSEVGATHKELKTEFVSSTRTSESSFNRAWKELKKSDRVVIEKDGVRQRLHAAEQADRTAVPAVIDAPGGSRRRS